MTREDPFPPLPVGEPVVRSEEILRAFFDASPHATTALDAQGRVIALNAASERMMDRPAEEVVGKPFPALPEGRWEQFRALLDAGLRGEVLRGLEVELVRRDGTSLTSSLSTAPLRAHDGRIVGVVAVTADITDRKRAEEALRESEERHRWVLANIDEVVYAVDVMDEPPYRRAAFVSDRTAGLVGRPAHEFVEDPGLWASLVHPQDLEEALRADEMVKETGRPVTRTYRIRHARSGEYRWFEDRITPWLDGDGRVARFVGVARDVTERRQAEDELRQTLERLRIVADDRRRLLGRLVSGLEAERARMARELHDSLGQLLTSISLFVKGLEDEASGRFAARLAECRALVERAMTTTRTLVWSLRPIELDDLGLVAAIERLAQEFGPRHGLRVDVRADGLRRRLPGEVETAAYRIVQEALTNVARHAGARSVSVVLGRRDGRFTAIVEDDGRGFDVSREAADRGLGGERMGMIGMRERASAVGGDLLVESSPGTGTTVRLEVPLTGQATVGEA